ncbi:HAD family hydrolase [Dyella caseinilytica]|uniref:HAD-IA family hydrolase n=1 Tax=Dyella caseinilytica TaxID=1849581 RepID=A0ABX7GXW3_9GAMM|nr:HAD-IA family hydrolase [Dyella caseinilytica]QRN54684.1 HAD-IA family hydrolase [Dyella caseinilytica]GFZ96045.1 phosphoglycolate phosphatase [Dyella caseinilytica]
MKSLPKSPQGVLFDLDGTLLDSAPDLHAALAVYCDEVGAAVPSYAMVREVVSRGSRAILRCAFAETDEQLFERMPRYLELYHSMMSRHTRPFEGIDPLLDAMEANGLSWGIVTNKPGYLTDELIRRIGWNDRVCAVVSGDTLPVRKPDPAPVLLACERGGLDPARCLFVGDDRRDVQAGNDAGLYSVAVHWGYLDGGDPHVWGADAVVEHPRQLAQMLQLKVVA